MLFNLLLLLIELWFLGALGLLLHYLSGRVGLLVIAFYLGALVTFLQYANPLSIFIRTDIGLDLVLGSNLYMPVILMLVMIIYIVNGTHYARLTIAGLLGLTLLALVVLLSQALHLSLPAGGNLAGLPNAQLYLTPDPRAIFASFMAFFADLVLLVVLYQALINRFKRLPPWLSATVATALTLVIDTFIFQTIAMIDTPLYGTLLVSNSIGKALGALLLSPLFFIYLQVIMPRQPAHVSVQERPVFDLWNVNLRQVWTDLLRSRDALAISEDSFRRLIENISEVLWLADGQMEVIYYISPAFEDIWGVPRTAFYLDPDGLLNMLHPEDRAIGLQRREPLLDERQRTLEYRIVRPDGSVRWVRERIFTIVNPNGAVESYAGLIEDISVRKQSEQQSMELMLERDRVKLMRNFISDASHDLRTPLTLLGLKVHLLKRVTDPQRQQQLIEELDQQITRLIALIESLLTLSWLDNEAALTYGRVAVSKPVRQVVEDMQVLAEQRRVTLTVEADEPLPRVLMIEGELIRAITNLVNNALNYTPEGGRVTVRCQQYGNRVMISVEDTGVGISAELLPHLFDRFFHADQWRVAQGKGSGLGLAIVRKIVDLHQGEISVESTVGVGSTFRLILPVDFLMDTASAGTMGGTETGTQPPLARNV